MHDRRPRPGQALMSTTSSRDSTTTTTTLVSAGTSVVVFSSAPGVGSASLHTGGAATTSSSSSSKASVSSAPSSYHRGGGHDHSDSSLESTICVNNPSAAAPAAEAATATISSASSVVSASSSPAALGHGCTTSEEQRAVGKRPASSSSSSSCPAQHPVESRSNSPHPSPHTQPRCSSSSNNNNINYDIDDSRRRHIRRRGTSATKKSVTFPRRRSELLQVRETICLDDFTDEEYRSYWMSDAEQAMILDMVDMTTALWSMGAKEDLDNHICYRGLEGKSEEAVEEYTERYLDLVSGILWAQENCRVAVEVQIHQPSSSPAGSDADGEYETDDTWSTADTGYYCTSNSESSDPRAATNVSTIIEYQIDHEQIADLYRQCTAHCQEVAFQRAQVDEYDACVFYMESTATSSILQQVSSHAVRDDEDDEDDYKEKDQRGDVYEEYEIDLDVEDDYTDSEEGHDDCRPNECE